MMMSENSDATQLPHSVNNDNQVTLDCMGSVSDTVTNQLQQKDSHKMKLLNNASVHAFQSPPFQSPPPNQSIVGVYNNHSNLATKNNFQKVKVSTSDFSQLITTPISSLSSTMGMDGNDPNIIVGNNHFCLVGELNSLGV